MNIKSLQLHPDFPDKVWVVVEQPADEEYRLKYDDTNETFIRTNVKSLSYTRGFQGAYGWIGGLGFPPGAHFDIFLITEQKHQAGDILLGYTCGIFYRRDNDHKLFALGNDVIRTVDHPDLACLNQRTYNQLMRLYPIVGEDEGWFGAIEACAYLKQQLARQDVHGYRRTICLKN